MTHKNMIEIFKTSFPNWGIKQYWKKGPNAIRIRLDAGLDVIFTYFSQSEWKLETMKMYEKSVDGI